MSAETLRCPWAVTPEAIAYHDQEWGAPGLDDRRQFEFLVLESAQAGLSWNTILRKRQGYARCFAAFDPALVAAFTERDILRLLSDPGIIRNRRKIEAAINNARHFLEFQARHGSFSKFLLEFIGGKMLDNRLESQQNMPASTPLTEKLAKELRGQGFKFLGPVILYSHLQGTGFINDHLVSCFRYEQIKQEAARLGLL